MTEYAELSDEERILLAAECVGRGVPIPHEIKALLGHELILIISNPGAQHDVNSRADDPADPPGAS